MSREKETFEFTPPDVSRVAAFLQTLCDAGGGWVNLLPGVVVDEDINPATESPSFFGLFGAKQPPVTMSTLMPPKPTRAAYDGVTLGLMHPAGGKAVRQLAALGVDVPTGWVVRQDHTRRDIVIRTAKGATPEEVVQWSVRAGAALCREEMTGRWQAVVYLP